VPHQKNTIECLEDFNASDSEYPFFIRGLVSEKKGSSIACWIDDSVASLLQRWMLKDDC